jgi:hypothetical protein
MPDEQGAASVETGAAEAGTGAAAETVADEVARLRRKVKIDGKETELEASEEELWNAYQHQTASRQRMTAADKASKQAQEEVRQAKALWQALQERPGALLERLSEQDQARFVASVLETPQLRQHLERRYADEIEYAQLPEEEKRQRELDRREATLREREAAYAQQTEAAQVEQLVPMFQKEFATAFGKALETAGLPANDETIGEMAAGVQGLGEAGEAVTPERLEEVAATVRDRLAQRRREHLLGLDKTSRMSLLSEHQEQLLADLEPEELAAVLGPHADRLRAYDLARVKAQQAEQAAAAEPAAPRPTRRHGHPEGIMTTEEFRAMRQRERYGSEG